MDKLNEELKALKEYEERESKYKQKIKKVKDLFANYNEMKTFDREVFQCVIEKVIIGCYNNDGQFNGDKIIFVFKTGDEVSGNVNTTKTKKNVIEKFEEEILGKNNNLCSYSNVEVNDLCSYSPNDACRECDFTTKKNNEVLMMKLKEMIENYKPYNEQEENDKKIMLKYIDSFDDVLTRNNEFGHFTASSWVVNKEKTKLLMIYHNIYQSWSWTGGHADGDVDLLGTAVRELKEETGVKNVKILNNDIFSLEIICVNGHVKRGKYVSSHVHLNLTFLLEVDENEVLKIKKDENSGVKWINIEDLSKFVSEEWMMEKIYKKLDYKLKNI